jgi:hypothetical protein
MNPKMAHKVACGCISMFLAYTFFAFYLAARSAKLPNYPFHRVYYPILLVYISHMRLHIKLVYLIAAWIFMPWTVLDRLCNRSVYEADRTLKLVGHCNWPSLELAVFEYAANALQISCETASNCYNRHRSRPRRRGVRSAMKPGKPHGLPGFLCPGPLPVCKDRP